MVRSGANSPEELCVRTYLTADPNLKAQFTIQVPPEIASLAASESAADLLTLEPLQPLFEFDVAFRPSRSKEIPFLDRFAAAAACGRYLS